MKTYITDIIPRLSKFSKQLDNLTLLTDQHWISLDVAGQKRIYIFRRNNELLVSTSGQVVRGKWEFISRNSLLIEVDETAFLLRHGFFDENILALKVDSKEEYAIFVNESKYNKELNSIHAINEFLESKYFGKTYNQSQELHELTKTIKENDGFSLTVKQIKVIILVGVLAVILLLIIDLL